MTSKAHNTLKVIESLPKFTIHELLKARHEINDIINFATDLYQGDAHALINRISEAYNIKVSETDNPTSQSKEASHFVFALDLRNRPELRVYSHNQPELRVYTHMSVDEIDLQNRVWDRFDEVIFDLSYTNGDKFFDLT